MPTPAMNSWSRSRPLIWVRRPASSSRKRSRVKSSASGSGPEPRDRRAPRPGRGRCRPRATSWCRPRSGRSPTRRRACTRRAIGDLPGRSDGGRQLVGPAQPAGPSEVEDEVRAVDVEVEELAVPVDAVDRRPLERLRRRVERLEHAERSRARPSSRRARRSARRGSRRAPAPRAALAWRPVCQTTRRPSNVRTVHSLGLWIPRPLDEGGCGYRAHSTWSGAGRDGCSAPRRARR